MCVCVCVLFLSPAQSAQVKFPQKEEGGWVIRSMTTRTMALAIGVHTAKGAGVVLRNRAGGWWL